MARIPIECLELSMRATNVLRRMRIFTVEQLLNAPIEKIANQNNIGVKTTLEIHTVVNQINSGMRIESLELSVRAINSLHHMGIYEVEQLLNTPIEKIVNQRNIGVKTITEIRDTMSKIASGIGDMLKRDGFKVDKNVYSEWQIEELSNHSITELNLSNRAMNVLTRIGCNTLDKLILMSEDDIMNLKGLGVKTCVEILNALKQWIKVNLFYVEEDEYVADISTEELDFYKELAMQISPIVQIGWKQLRSIVDEIESKEDIKGEFSRLAVSDDCISKVLNMSEFEHSLKNLFLRFVPHGIIRIEDMETVFSSLELMFDINILIRKYSDGTICTIRDKYCYLNRPHAMQYVLKNYSNLEYRNKEIILRRMQGENLQSIGDSYSLSRERVRQILVKIVKSFPPVYEDYFREPYEYFKFSKEEFCTIFPSCGKEGYEYLAIKYKRGDESIAFSGVSRYNRHNRLFCEKIKVYLDEISVKEDKLVVSRTDMVYRVLMSNSDKSMTIDEFIKEYYDYIERKNYPRERLIINKRTITNFLRHAKHIVVDKNNFVRYCKAEPQIIWNTIDFFQYKNLVVSAELIYRDYEELMEELDIRDGYELFYIIKSSLEYWDVSFFEINCRRVPVIVMGNGNEGQQAIQLLKEISPIDLLSYYEAYEEKFGLRKESAQGNPVIARVLSNYYNEGIYAIDVPEIEENDIIPFTKVLQNKNFWFMDELEQEFAKLCICSSADAFNRAAFKCIGYCLNVGYAYSNKYSSVTNYFNEEIFSINIVDLNNLDRRLINLPVFESTLLKKKLNLEYIEVAPKVLMAMSEIERIYRITEQDIKTLQGWILNCKDKYFNAHSVWDKLKNDGLIEKLQNNEWMCTCIFRQQEAVFSLPVAGGIILGKESSELNLGLICKWFVENNGKMSIHNLTTMLNDTFCTKISVSKIAEKVKEYGVWEMLVTDSFDEYINTLVINMERDMDEEDLFQEEFF